MVGVLIFFFFLRGPIGWYQKPTICNEVLPFFFFFFVLFVKKEEDKSHCPLRKMALKNYLKSGNTCALKRVDIL